MGFNPKAVAAMKLKEAKIRGNIVKNPMAPQNMMSQLPNLAPVAKIPTPVANATISAFKPQIPGLPSPPTEGVVRKFSALREKLGGF